MAHKYRCEPERTGYEDGLSHFGSADLMVANNTRSKNPVFIAATDKASTLGLVIFMTMV